MSSRKVLYFKSICDALRSDRFQIVLLLILLISPVVILLWRHESRLIIEKRDEKIVKEFLHFLEIKRREEAIKDSKALQIRMNDLEALIGKTPNVAEYFPVPKNIFNNKWLGEGGFAVKMPKNVPEPIQKIIKEGFKVHKFNQYLSDVMSVSRSLPDKSSSQCLRNRYSYRKKLPSTSIIIIFHNEAWSTLLRSVHSIINRTPHRLIHEIILVDDSSTFGEFKTQVH